MMKFVLGFAAICALAVIVPAVLVLTNLMPLFLANALPFVKTYVVQGEVRMTDGTSKPPEPVTVEIRTSRGKHRKLEASADNGFTYSVTFMGFRDPLRPGDTVHFRATMPFHASLGALTVAEEKDRILLADFDRGVLDATTAPVQLENEVFADKRIQSYGEPPADDAGWAELPLASVQNLANPQNPSLEHVGVDSQVQLVARFQPMGHAPGADAFKVTMPPAASLEALRLIMLRDVGEVLHNEPFAWEKKKVSVPFTFTGRGGSDTTVTIVDAAGGEVRLERLGTTSRNDPITWPWDGRDNNGQYAPEGTYTLVATANSFGIGNGAKEFTAEIRGRGATRIRYARFTPQSTVGDFLDSFALTLQERITASGLVELELAEAIRIFDAAPSGEPRTVVRTFRGTDTLSTTVTSLGLALDPVMRVSDATHVGRFRLLLTGGAQLQSRPAIAELESMDAVRSQAEFLQLPLSRVYAVEGTKKEPVVADRPLELRVLMSKESQETQDWEYAGTMREIPPIVVQPTDNLNSVIQRLDAIPDVSVTIRGTIDLQPKYDARIASLNGERISLYRGEVPEAGALTANIRAAGLYGARPVLDAVPGALPADGATMVPIEATLIGLDGNAPTADTIAVKASAGSISSLSAEGGVYRGMYVVPSSTADVTVNLELTSQALQQTDADQPEGLAVLHKAAVSIPLVGAMPAPIVEATGQTPPLAAATSPTEGVPATNGQAAAQPTMDQQELRKRAKLLAELKPQTAAELMLLLPQEEARAILLVMSSRDAGKIVDAMFGGEAAEGEASPDVDARKRSLAKILSGANAATPSSNP